MQSRGSDERFKWGSKHFCPLDGKQIRFNELLQARIDGLLFRGISFCPIHGTGWLLNLPNERKPAP